MSQRAVACVLELGMSAEGEIAALASICTPSIRVVLNVGPAHLDTLGSLEAVGRAKGELVRTARPGDCCVLNADDPRVADMPVPQGCTKVLFGWAPHADVRILAASRVPSGTSIRVVLQHRSRDGATTEEAEVEIASPLLALASNVAAAAAAAVAAGVPLPEAVASMASFGPVKQRMHIEFLDSAGTLNEDTSTARTAGAACVASQGPSRAMEGGNGPSGIADGATLAGSGTEGGNGPFGIADRAAPAGSGTGDEAVRLVLIDDSYNANPTSMAAALQLLRTFPERGRRYAVLGDMLELGAVAVDEHRRMLQLCCDSGDSWTASPEPQGLGQEQQQSSSRLDEPPSTAPLPPDVGTGATSTGAQAPGCEGGQRSLKDPEASPRASPRISPPAPYSKSEIQYPVHGLILVGPQFCKVLAGLQEDGAALPPIAQGWGSAEDAAQWLTAQLKSGSIGGGDVVLVKGSRSMRMDLVAAACRAALPGRSEELSKGRSEDW